MDYIFYVECKNMIAEIHTNLKSLGSENSLTAHKNFHHFNSMA